MENLKLNSGDMTKLILDKYLEISNNNFIEIQNNNIVFNNSGDIYNLESVNLTFKERKIQINDVIHSLKNLVEEHFNLEPYNIIPKGSSSEEYDYIIHFAPNTQWNIIVCPYTRALENMRALSDEPFDANPDDDYIGIYKKLGKSCYYFRWFNDF